MISEIRPPNPAFAKAGQAALQAMISLARNPATADERVSDRATEIGRAALAALTPERCVLECPFCSAMVSEQRTLTSCWLGLRPVAMRRCPLHPVAVNRATGGVGEGESGGNNGAEVVSPPHPVTPSPPRKESVHG